MRAACRTHLELEISTALPAATSISHRAPLEAIASFRGTIEPKSRRSFATHVQHCLHCGDLWFMTDGGMCGCFATLW
jgi:hypothetical protein